MITSPSLSSSLALHFHLLVWLESGPLCGNIRDTLLDMKCAFCHDVSVYLNTEGLRADLPDMSVKNAT